jgi:UDP-N-acetyl-D-glucosamine dehydrogenase
MGQGYVGLPLAMAAVKAGHTVIGFEPNHDRFCALEDATSYIEDVTFEQLKEALATGRYTPAYTRESLTGFDIGIITVPTPLKHGQPDLSYVEQAATDLAVHITTGATVILESTVNPGATRSIVGAIIEDLSCRTMGTDFHLGYSPERIDPGNETWNFENTPKLVSGLTPACAQKVELFYRSITHNVVLADSLEAAETAKVFENVWRQVNIALVNELQRHAHTLGLNVHHILDLAATKPFGFTRFTPGPGVGGHCIPCDPVYLSEHLRREHGTRFQLIELAQDINEGQPGYVVRRLQDALSNRFRLALNGAQILALGQAYKPNTSDMRESPAVEVVSLLRDAGARVTTVDPFFAEEDIDQLREIPDDSTGLLPDYDAVVLLTPHTAFDLQHIATYANYVLDTRGVMPDASNIERL